MHRTYLDEWAQRRNRLHTDMAQHCAEDFVMYQQWLHGASRLKLKLSYAAEAIDSDDEEYMAGYDEFTREGTQHERGPPAHYVVRTEVTIVGIFLSLLNCCCNAGKTACLHE